MAFVDEVRIHVAAGRGGDGVIRWLRNKQTARGGPNGGDGGRGGDVYLEGVRDLSALTRYRHTKKFAAENGVPGEAHERHGANGASLYLRVPVGTTATVVATGKQYDILEEGQTQLVLRGGNGGKGNAHFKGSTNQNPFQQTNGKEGETSELTFELKLIADIGLVGLPSAGKSSLLNALTRAKSKTGAYPFTTLEPHLGVLNDYIIADIPGLIEGASSGKGLGSRFLKHIERTKYIVYLVSVERDSFTADFDVVRNELEQHNPALLKKDALVLATKTDLVDPAVLDERIATLSAHTHASVMGVSIYDLESITRLAEALTQLVHRREEQV